MQSARRQQLGDTARRKNSETTACENFPYWYQGGRHADAAGSATQLVVTGFDRYVRNPMYVGLLLALTGQALLFGSLGLLLYAAAVWIIAASFVHWYERVVGRRPRPA